MPAIEKSAMWLLGDCLRVPGRRGGRADPLADRIGDVGGRLRPDTRD